MAYLGKEFAVDKEENYDTFIDALGLPEPLATKYKSYRPTVKLEKNGDTYTNTTVTPEGSRTSTFQSGVEFDDAIRPDLIVKSKYTVDGNTITQEISKDDKSVTFKREYSDNELKVTITGNFFDGVAYRYYKSV